LAADEIPATVSADALTMLETLPIALRVDDGLNWPIMMPARA